MIYKYHDDSTPPVIAEAITEYFEQSRIHDEDTYLISLQEQNWNIKTTKYFLTWQIVFNILIIRFQ